MLLDLIVVVCAGLLVLIVALFARDWKLTVVSAMLVMSLLGTMLVVASQPVNTKPTPPFILYASAGPWAWAGQEGEPPRTYLWEVPPELAEELQDGPLMIQKGNKDLEERGDPGEYFPWGEYQVSPFEPTIMRKE